MDTSNLLHKNYSQTRAEVLKILNHTEQSITSDVATIKAWLETQAHLPEITEDVVIEKFLIINKGSIERTKEKIDMYYTIRSLVPELYHNKHPLLPHMQEMSQIVFCTPLPKLTEEFHRIIVLKLKDVTADKFDVYNFFAHTFNITEVRFHEELHVSDVLVYDLKGFTMGHLLKITPIHLKKASVVLERVYSNRLHEIHFMNCPLAESLVKLVKNVLNPKLTKRIHLHKDPSTLLARFGSAIIPKDYGGEETTLQELNDLWKKKLEEYKGRFDKLVTMTVNETLRPAPLENDDILGFHGNFKQLSVD